MDVHNLPLVLFTVIGQMCVGTFLTLGVMQLVLTARHGRAVTQRIIEPVVYAIGPVMVAGLLASMLHMHDLTNTFWVIANWQTSWLSREIIFGAGFAALGFLFAILEWFKLAGFVVRQIVAWLAAIFGIALVWSMSQVYYSVVTIPAWNNAAVPVQFFATALILGPLAVATALSITAAVRVGRTHAANVTPASASSNDTSTASSGASTGGAAGQGVGARLAAQIRGRITKINAVTTSEEWQITRSVIRWLAVAAALAAVVVLISYPLYLSSLSGGNAEAVAAAATFGGPLFAVRLALLALAAIVLGDFIFRIADRVAAGESKRMATLMVVCLALAFIAEIVGRFFHYGAMLRVGI